MKRAGCCLVRSLQGNKDPLSRVTEAHICFLSFKHKTSLETGEKEAEIRQTVSYQQKYCVESKSSDFLGGFLFFFAARTHSAFPFP